MNTHSLNNIRTNCSSIQSYINHASVIHHSFQVRQINKYVHQMVSDRVLVCVFVCVCVCVSVTII